MAQMGKLHRCHTAFLGPSCPEPRIKSRKGGIHEDPKRSPGHPGGPIPGNHCPSPSRQSRFQAPDLQEGLRRHREPQLHRLGHPEQPDGVLGRGFQQEVPQRQDSGRRQGLHHGPPGAHRRHQPARPHEPGDEGRGDGQVREEVRLQAHQGGRRHRHPGGLRQQEQPDQDAQPPAGGRHLLQDPQGRRCQGHQDLGRARSYRGCGQPHPQPLRPQQRQRHLRLLQGARPLQG